MACPCGCDPAPQMDSDFMVLLEEFRRKVGPVTIVKGGGYRCEAYNKKIGGAENSQHLYRQAADVKAKRVPHWVAVMAATFLKFRGMGFGKGKLHLDDRAGPMAWWVYQSKREHIG